MYCICAYPPVLLYRSVTNLSRMFVSRIVPGTSRDTLGAFRSAPSGIEKKRSNVPPVVIAIDGVGFHDSCCSTFVIDPYAYLKLFSMLLKTYQ